MALCETQRHRLPRERGIVFVRHVEEPGPRIVDARFVAGARQLDDRVAHAHAGGFSGCRDAAETFDEPSTGTAAASAGAARATADERELGLHLAVLRKGGEAGRVDAAAAR